jgi:hypothetical protein
MHISMAPVSRYRPASGISGFCAGLRARALVAVQIIDRHDAFERDYRRGHMFSAAIAQRV